MKVVKARANALVCYVDGIKYPSLFAAAIDFELNYSWVYLKTAKNNGAPVTINGHEIFLENWLEKNPEYLKKKGAKK